LDDFLTENPGLKIIKSEIKNIDSLSQPIEEIFEVSINEHIEEFGDEIAIYPLFYQRENENPFKLEERSYPIDFAYKSEKNVIVNLEIPENMEFIEIPEPTKVSLPDNAGYFMYQCVASGKKLNLSYKYAINKELFDTSEYATLKEFINQVIITHSKPVIIKNS